MKILTTFNDSPFFPRKIRKKLENISTKKKKKGEFENGGNFN